MAISIVQFPSFTGTTTVNGIMPVYNTIAFTVNSTNKTQCQFQYICDVYVNGTFAKRLKLFPTGASGYATFKVERVLQDFVSYDLHQNLYGTYLFSENPNSIIRYNLKFGEEYDSSAQCDSGTTIYPDLTLSSGVYDFMAFNAALQKKEWLQYFYSNYLPASSANKFLTGFPNNAMIKQGDQMTFNIFNNTSCLKLQVKTYGSTGSLLGTYTYTNPYQTFTNAQSYLVSIGVGPENLNNTTLLSGTQPVIDGDVYYYTVQTLGFGDSVSSELKRIDIDKRETEWNNHRLWWLGRLGNFDSYTFTLKDSRSLSISRTEFNRLIGEYAALSPGAEWTYGIEERGRTTLNVNAQQSKTFISNWLTEREALWIEELFTSVEVYEITRNAEICFGEITVDSGNVVIEVGYDSGLVVGDTIAINVLIGEVAYAALIGEFEITAITETTISITSPLDPINPPTGAICACLTVVDFVAELYPLIIKTSSWDEKVKSKVKNINYSIEVDNAEGINLQRN